MKTNFILSLAFIFLASMTSCKNYEELKAEPAGVTGVPTIEGLTFARIRDEVLVPKCVSCHKNYHLNYDDYDTVKGRIDLIVQRVSDGSMPEDGVLEDDLKNLLFAWANDGAPLGDDSDTGGVEPITDELEPTWESVNKNIFRQKCVSCHNPGGIYPSLPFVTRFDVFSKRDLLLDFEDPEKSYLIEVITDPFEPMPPVWSSLPAVTDEEVEVLKEWIRLGLP